MKFAKHFSTFAVLVFVASLWGVVFVGYAGEIDGRCVRFCGSSTGGGGEGGEGAILRWFRERSERHEQERREEERLQQQYHETVQNWNRIAREYEKDYRAQQGRDTITRQENLRRARRSAQVMHAWNDLGVEAYQAGDLGNAVTYFKAAQHISPGSPDVRHNLQRAESKLSAEAEGYLSSLQTALGIAGLWPHLLIFHPDPNIRAEANRQLARESMEKIAEAATTFVAEERLGGGKIEPFPWETEAERTARRQEAMDHARKVESLRLEALEEARSLAEALMVSESKEDIRIQTKPAMKQLLKVCISGFQ